MFARSQIDPAALAQENIRMHSRMTKDAATDKAERETTRKRRQYLSRNLKWEIRKARTNKSKLTERIKQFEGCENIVLTTVDKWVSGNAANLSNKYREALAEIFGYQDPDSILNENHINERSPQPSERFTAIGNGIGHITAAIVNTRARSRDDVLQTVEHLMDDPDTDVYVRILVHWLASYSA